MTSAIRNICRILVGALFLQACSATEELTDALLLHDVKVKSASKDIDPSLLSPYVRQRPQVKWFFVKKNTIYNPLLTQRSVLDLTTAMQNMGYMNAHVDVDTIVKEKKLKLTYTLHPNDLFFIRQLHYDIKDSTIAGLILGRDSALLQLKEGMVFSVNELDEERKRITRFLNDNGYFRFHKDYIRYTADTLSGSTLVDVTMHLQNVHVDDGPDIPHPRYMVRDIRFVNGEDSVMHLRKSVLNENTWIKSNAYYCASDLQKTYDLFGRLPAVKYTNINFTERPDSTSLDCDIHISTNKPNTISFQPEGTNTAGDLGAAASLTYQNRNLFRGSETFSILVRGAYEAITGLEGYQNQDYTEYNIETRLTFPRFLLPLLSASFRKKSTATSELLVSYNLQNRPEFHRRLLNASWRYHWADAPSRTTYRVDLIDINYIYMPWLSETFKREYLDNANRNNAILRYNYSDLFILKLGFSMARTTPNAAFKMNLETAGNLLQGLNAFMHFRENSQGRHTLFNIAYAQYAKADFDFTYALRFSSNNELALHVGFGIAYPYGNSNALPFEKRYFAGGPNSVRGWSVRTLGPGSFSGSDGAIDFINQTGDMKLDLNAEYRTHLFWKLDGAIFADAGNVWTLRNYQSQPGGQFKINKFYKQLAVAYGIGLRLNFSYFILRFDAGMKAVDPSENAAERIPFLHPNLKRDFALHFAVGLPF